MRACCVLCAVSGILLEMIKCGGSCLQDSLMQLVRSVVNTGSVTQAWANLFPRKVTWKSATIGGVLPCWM